MWWKSGRQLCPRFVTKEGYMTDREQFPVAVSGISVWAEVRHSESRTLQRRQKKKSTQWISADSIALWAETWRFSFRTVAEICTASWKFCLLTNGNLDFIIADENQGTLRNVLFNISLLSHKEFLSKSSCRRPLEIGWVKGEDNIEMDLKEGSSRIRMEL